jgi:hypothetical protein
VGADPWVWLGRITAVPCGFAAFFLGLSILRVWKAPQGVRDRFSEPPRYLTALGAGVIGLVVAVLSIFGPN